MIDIKRLEQGDEKANYKKNLSDRGSDPTEVDRLLSLNQRRKKLIGDFESKRAEQNKVGQEIAIARREKKGADDLLAQMKELSSHLKNMEAEMQLAADKVHDLLATLPNQCHSSVPVGESEEDNQLVRKVGDPEKLPFNALEHWELGENLGILDFETAATISGARFVALKGLGAKLERSLINLMLDLHTENHGYTETLPPFIVNSQSLFGTSQFPKFKDDVFHLEGTDYHLIPTAEVPVTNYYAGKILKEGDLPIAYTAFTPCFRSEAGSYGKDTKGLIRQHQFNKVELVRFCHPDQSYEQHEQLVGHAEEVLKRLELPYRVMSLCTGDIGFGAAKCYDIEVWLPGQDSYREISSCSNFEDFQSRRANIRFRAEKGKPQFVHTLNGSGLAVGRTIVALLENCQQEDGSIVLPKALEPYIGQRTIRKGTA